MTAEIAILNRRAVTFAADSAMTISQTGKAYNSADKIFELSTAQPIGMMVYNQLDYMGMPLDVLIKQFRESAYCKMFNHVHDVPDLFFEFLNNEFTVLGDDEEEHVATLVATLFTHVREQYIFTVISHDLRGFPHGLFQRTITETIEEIENIAISECYYDLDVDNFLSRYDSAFMLAIEDVFEPLPPLDDDDRRLLKRLAALGLQRNWFSPLHTGFVFSGYGSNQLFPALKSYIFDGMIMGRLKRRERDSVAIDANNVRARIVPFAQREMVDRFLFGIDQRHERTVIDNLRIDLEQFSKAIIGFLPGIMFMAKSDLANFAEALVNITSVKRRASLDTESVGGPIDVAVISKDDGFVWVQRKHYFDPALNPRFFARKYGGMAQRDGGRHDKV